MTFQEQTDQIRASIHLLAKLPVRILKPITSTKTVKKADMLADLAFNLDFHGIEVTESVLDSDFLVFKFAGEKVGAIDIRRGRQEFQLPSAEWSTEWDKFFVYLIIQKRAIASRQETVIIAEEADAMQDRYEDSTDQSLSQDERDFVREFGDLADNILSQIGRTDCLELIKDDDNQFRVVDTDRDGYNVIWTRYDSRLWGTSVYSWGKVTPNPLEHLTHYVDNIS